MDIATLGIKVDSAPAVAGAANLDKLTASAARADAAADRLATNTGKVAPAMSGAGQGARMFAQQLSQVAQQGSATGNYVQALAIQLPDLAMGFGAVGIAAGVVASVALPALIAALSDGGKETLTFGEALDNLESSMSRLRETADLFSSEGLTELAERYGELNAEIIRHIELMRQVDMREAMEASKDTIQSLAAELTGFWTDQYNGLRDTFGLSLEQANLMDAAMRRASQAGTFDQQVTALTQLRDGIMQATGGIENMTTEQFAFYTKVQDSLDGMLQLSNSAADAGWLSGMISEAQTLAGSLWDAVGARLALADGYAGMGDDERGSQRGERASAGAFRSQDAVRERLRGGMAGGGGGGGASDQYAAQLEALVGSISSERQILEEWYAESEAMLMDRRAIELLGAQEHREAMLQLEEEYQRRLLEIDEQGGNARWQLAQSVFGGLADFASAMGEKGVKAARVFGAAEALINVGRAQAQTLSDPKLSFWQKIPAMLAVGAAGMRVVTAIRSGSSASGGGGAGIGSTVAAQGQQTPATPAPQEWIIRGLSKSRTYTGEEIAEIFDGLAEESQKRGIPFNVRFT